MIEVRDYHYDPERLDEYRAWAAEAGPYLRDRWDVDGFWISTADDPIVMGSDPALPLGPANVTWVIRWPDMATREAEWENLWADDKWNDLWDRHPGFEGYRQLLVRFMDPV